MKILAFVYKLIGRKTIAKSLVTTSRCTTCDQCKTICPNDALSIKGNTVKRNNKCKGCLLCVYACPEKAFELPVISISGVFLLIFLPYDRWIIQIFSLPIVPDMWSIKYLPISLLLWGIGYALAFAVYKRLLFIFSLIPLFRRAGEKPFIRNLRNKIHPALIFPALIIKKNASNAED